MVKNSGEHSRRVMLATVIAGLWVVACLPGCSPSAETPRSDAPPLSANAPGTSSDSVPTPAVAEKILPVSAETRQVYQWYCTQCHGVKGHGDGINSPHLVVPPRNHSKADYLETRSDRQLFEAIKLGGLAVGRAPCMPAWGYTFGDETIRSLVRYIRELCACEAL